MRGTVAPRAFQASEWSASHQATGWSQPIQTQVARSSTTASRAGPRKSRDRRPSSMMVPLLSLHGSADVADECGVDGVVRMQASPGLGSRDDVAEPAGVGGGAGGVGAVRAV